MAKKNKLLCIKGLKEILILIKEIILLVKVIN